MDGRMDEVFITAIIVTLKQVVVTLSPNLPTVKQYLQDRWGGSGACSN